MQRTPSSEQIKTALTAADTAVEAARRTRNRLGRRRTPSREDSLKAAAARCAEAAKPLRSLIGMVAWHNLSTEDELAMKDAIARLRYERRQISKML